MTFLGQLSNQISSQFSLGENNTHSLDAVIDGSNVKYGSLGDFAKQIDQSAQRSYVEEGYLRRDPYNTDPKQLEILMQQPDATVLVKKRMFSSVGDNFRPDFMDSDEKMYLKATRILFQNKCNKIAALEKLSKIQKITAAVGQVSDQLVPIIITLTDQLNYGSSLNPFSSGLFGQSPDSNPYSTNQISNFTSVVDKLRKVYVFNRSNPYTTWITDPSNLFQSTLGQGTGVMEITNFTNISTTTSVEMESAGSFSLTISDPYEAMVISDYDIEIALSDATNQFYNHKIFQFGTQAANNVMQDLQAQLSQVRQSRNASPLTFNVDPDTLLSSRVTVIIDRLGVELVFTYNANGSAGFPGLGGSGGSVTVDPSYLKGGAIAGYDGLATTPSNVVNGNSTNVNDLSSELALFQSLVAATFNQLQMQANSQNSFQTSNELTNYARRKMRFNFLGNLLIQPMDNVHIYLTSKSRYDNKVLSGLQNMLTGVGVLQNLNNTVTDFKNTFDALFRPSGSIPLQLEKAVYVGPTFPNYLWSLMRTQFVTEKEGVHVFAGVVDSANEGWSDGKFTIDVRGKDNSTYFEQGKVNFKPGVDVFNGSWFDPMTPFKSSFDQISADYKNNTQQLLKENEDLFASGGVKFKLGPFAGSQATASNYIQDRSVDPYNGLVTKIFYAPDGLVYKWREGIGVFTQAGLSNQINDPSRVGSPNLYKEPFAGQDIMNVLSLLITGTPYNFTTFYKAVLGDGNYGVDPQSNQNAAFAFINSVTSQIAKNNTLWGNFIPFKSLTVDEASYAQAQFNQFTITKYNNELDNKIQQYQSLLQKSVLFTRLQEYAPNLNTSDPNFIDVSTQISNLKTDINNTISNINTQNSTFYQQAGKDPTFDYNQFSDSGGTNAITDPQTRKNLRRQINYLTRRMSYDVRFNDDKNLFIVDDYYDKDYDILAYASSLTDGIKIWNNEFTSVKEKILQTSKLLNLEVFCDTQGHVRVRAPQYNRMPSSVFYRMMYLKQTLNIQIFPEYLNSLFKDQIQGIKTQIEVVEDEIRLDCAILGANTDNAATAFIQNGTIPGSNSTSNTGTSSSSTSNTGASFAFLSDSGSGEITDINSLVQQANPDVGQSQGMQGISNYQNVKQQAGNKQVFTNSQRFTAINQLITQQQQSQSGYNTSSNVNAVSSSTYVNNLIERIYTKSGQKLAVKDFIQTNAAGVQFVSIPTNQTIDIFKTTHDLQDKISSRQRLLKLFYSTIKNAAELKSLDTSKTISNQLITPGGFGNSKVPEVFEHMIEDESYDDYGPGSGSRYIIKRAQIKNWNITTNSPPYTTVEVQGILNPFLSDPGNLPSALNFFPGSGNGMVTAMAVDYDMWRSYGFKGQSTIQVPFLSDPVTQCGPYAAMLLSIARKNIIRGSLTISGNEFMQPGEVVFLEDRGLLFYVTSVRHNLTLASGFTTTLELSYGHSPGEYIPTTMDFIGKLIYKNGNDGTTIIQRQDNSGNETSMGALQLGSNVNASSSASDNAINSGGANQTPNPTSDFNGKVLNNILFMVHYMVNANNTDNNNVMAGVEIRLYYDNSNPPSQSITQFASQIQDALTGSADGPKNFPSIKNNTNTSVPSDFVKVVRVNLDDQTERRSPSQKAWDAARNQSSSSSFGSDSGVPGEAIRQALFSYIVDCWIVVSQNTPSTSATNTAVSTASSP